jgi:superoxide dismutase, Fe-Mn family
MESGLTMETGINTSDETTKTDAAMLESPILQPDSRILHRRDFLKQAATLGGVALALSNLRLNALAADPATTATAPKNPAPIKAKSPVVGPQGKLPPKTETASKAISSTTASSKKAPAQHPVQPYNPDESIVAKTFPNLSTVDGLSPNQLNQHIELYTGYVKKINEIETQISAAPAESLSLANPTYSGFRELHHEQTYALNAVVLHEYYFENLGGALRPPTDTEMFHTIISKEFGSWESYISQLKAVGKLARGWAITGYNMRDHRIHNYALDLHNQNVPMQVIPLVVLDVYEHAYMIDFGTHRAAYLDAFFRNINWQVADARLKTMMFHA